MQESNRLASNLYFYKMKDYLEVAGTFIKITEWMYMESGASQQS